MRHASLTLLMVAAAAAAVTGVPAGARADWGMPNMYISLAWLTQTHALPATLLVVPDGSGPPLSQARLPYGQVVDQVLHLQVFDDVGLPMDHFEPDGWSLTWQDDGVHGCGGGLPPDRATGPDGMTEWAQPLHAGGQSRALMHVRWFGSPLLSNSGLVLQANSPDLNGDLVVDLLDVVLFAQDLFTDEYKFRSDLSYDWDVNLSDVVLMARHLGARCP